MKLKRNYILFLTSLLILISSLAVEGCATAQINFEDVKKKHGIQKQLTMLQKNK